LEIEGIIIFLTFWIYFFNKKTNLDGLTTGNACQQLGGRQQLDGVAQGRSLRDFTQLRHRLGGETNALGVGTDFQDLKDVFCEFLFAAD
jgi:hypothetical protein